MNDTQINRDALLQVVRTWVGTPSHHQARLKQVGVDCIGTLYGPAVEFGFKLVDVAGYSVQPYGKVLIAELAERLDQIPIEEAKDADIFAFWFETVEYPAHVGWNAPGQYGPNVIHTLSGKNKKCVEHRINEWWRERIHSAWRLRWQP